MKKNIFLAMIISVMFGFSGCSDGYYDRDDLTTLFLVDDEGVAYSSVPYKCDSMRRWDETGRDGAFTFYPEESCEFDFDGLNGTDDNDTLSNDLVYIVDDIEEGKNGIPYECELFSAAKATYTYYDDIYDGSFDYDADDACVFYF